jgi:hypothetical protein
MRSVTRPKWIGAVGLALVLGACDVSKQETFKERRFYYEFLKRFYEDANEGGTWKGFAIERLTPPKQRFLGEDKEEDWAWLHKRFGTLRRDTFDDFWARNQKRHELPGRVRAPFDIRWLSETESDTLFAHGPREGWRRFYADHPTLKGILRVSLAGVSADGKQALVYFGHQTQPLAGRGGFVLLTQMHRGWRIADRLITWVS